MGEVPNEVGVSGLQHRMGRRSSASFPIRQAIGSDEVERRVSVGRGLRRVAIKRSEVFIPGLRVLRTKGEGEQFSPQITIRNSSGQTYFSSVPLESLRNAVATRKAFGFKFGKDELG